MKISFTADGEIQRLHARARRVLGVPETADANEVKRVFRELARKRQADVGGDHGSFTRIVNAYLILTSTDPRGFLSEQTAGDRMDVPEGPDAYLRWWKKGFWP
jgi:hypothetical protein